MQNWCKSGMNRHRVGAKLAQNWRETGAKWRQNQDVLSYVSKVGSISISEAEEILPGVSRRSIQRRLKQLVDEGYLELVGETREAKYILNQRDK